MLMLVIIAANGKIKIMPDITLKQIKEICKKHKTCDLCLLFDTEPDECWLTDELSKSPASWDLKEIEERIKGE